VVELQERLRQVLLYSGVADGHYTSEVRDSVSSYQSVYNVQGDPDGIYGANTRASLESRTTEP
jgi:peptidoglycan hydrolase-like protein with peptidoglycan-binding domain